MAAGNPAEAPGSSPGPAVDRTGQPVVDPTQNVLDLVNAAIRRQDDLREMQAGYTTQIGEMREQHARYIAELRSEYQKELREAETARIDAIRAVDVGAVNRAAEVSATQAATLATQVATSAEALRGQVEAARQQTATALAAALEPIQKDIQDLRRAQYEAQGQKTQVVESTSSDQESRAVEAARIQAAAQRNNVYGLVIAAIVLALSIYAAFHHLARLLETRTDPGDEPRRHRVIRRGGLRGHRDDRQRHPPPRGDRPAGHRRRGRRRCVPVRPVQGDPGGRPEGRQRAAARGSGGRARDHGEHDRHAGRRDRQADRRGRTGVRRPEEQLRLRRCHRARHPPAAEVRVPRAAAPAGQDPHTSRRGRCGATTGRGGTSGTRRPGVTRGGGLRS